MRAASAARMLGAMEELGFKFYLWLAGVVIAGGFVLLIVMLIFTRAIYAFGVIGAFIFLAAVLLLVGWLYDRRQERRRGMA